MQSTVLKRFESPDETQTFEKGRFGVVHMYVSVHSMGADRYAHGVRADRAPECTT